MLRSQTQTEASVKRKEIEVHDERNIRIREKVGWQICRIVNYVLCGLILLLGFLKICVTAMLLLAAVLVMEFILEVFLSNYGSKRM